MRIIDPYQANKYEMQIVDLFSEFSGAKRYNRCQARRRAVWLSPYVLLTAVILNLAEVLPYRKKRSASYIPHSLSTNSLNHQRLGKTTSINVQRRTCKLTNDNIVITGRNIGWHFDRDLASA